jgi:hypothetical protein
MKKAILFLFAILFMGSAKTQDWVTIPDADSTLYLTWDSGNYSTHFAEKYRTNHYILLNVDSVLIKGYPVVPAITPTVISHWNTAYSWGNHSGLYKPISYSPNSSEILSSLGFTPYNSTNPEGYISSVPAQSFSSLTGKPTTLSGYGITDAYPLSGNPSGFLTSFTEVDGSITNEIELPNQSSNDGKFLQTNGSSVSWQNIVSPGSDNAKAYSSGTVYNITTTSAKVDFGTTDPSITITSAGTYLIMSNIRVDYSGLTNVAANTVTAKLRRTNNTAADITNATGDFIVPPVTLLTSTGGDCDVNTVIYTTSNNNDTIELWASRSGSISVGNIQAGNAWIVAIRIY